MRGSVCASEAGVLRPLRRHREVGTGMLVAQLLTELTVLLLYTAVSKTILNRAQRRGSSVRPTPSRPVRCGRAGVLLVGVAVLGCWPSDRKNKMSHQSRAHSLESLKTHYRYSRGLRGTEHKAHTLLSGHCRPLRARALSLVARAVGRHSQ